MASHANATPKLVVAICLYGGYDRPTFQVKGFSLTTFFSVGYPLKPDCRPLEFTNYMITTHETIFDLDSHPRLFVGVYQETKYWISALKFQPVVILHKSWTYLCSFCPLIILERFTSQHTLLHQNSAPVGMIKQNWDVFLWSHHLVTRYCWWKKSGYQVNR